LCRQASTGITCRVRQMLGLEGRSGPHVYLAGVEDRGLA